MWNSKLVTMNLDFYLRQFLSKVLKIESGFLLFVAEEEIERELLSKKEPRLDNLEIFQPVQTTEDINSSRFTVWRVYSGQKAKAVAGPLFANPLEG